MRETLSGARNAPRPGRAFEPGGAWSIWRLISPYLLRGFKKRKCKEKILVPVHFSAVHAKRQSSKSKVTLNSKDFPEDRVKARIVPLATSSLEDDLTEIPTEWPSGVAMAQAVQFGRRGIAGDVFSLIRSVMCPHFSRF